MRNDSFGHRADSGRSCGDEHSAQVDSKPSRARITNRAHLDGDGPVAKGAARDQVRKEMPMLPLVLSSDSHVFEPPDLWQTRIDAPFRDRAPRIERIGGADQIVVEADQILSGIGLISNAGPPFEAPATISAHGRFEDLHPRAYDPAPHLKDMTVDGWPGPRLYP